VAGRIAVKPVDLERFASQVDQVRQELSSSLDHLDGQAFGVQSALVLDALRDFSRAWSDRRSELVEELKGAADVLRSAAAEFAGVDHQLASGLDQGGTPCAGDRDGTP
jgi:uncharacterized protein YukE